MLNEKQQKILSSINARAGKTLNPWDIKSLKYVTSSKVIQQLAYHNLTGVSKELKTSCNVGKPQKTLRREITEYELLSCFEYIPEFQDFELAK